MVNVIITVTGLAFMMSLTEMTCTHVAIHALVQLYLHCEVFVYIDNLAIKVTVLDTTQLHSYTETLQHRETHL